MSPALLVILSNCHMGAEISNYFSTPEIPTEECNNFFLNSVINTNYPGIGPGVGCP